MRRRETSGESSLKADSRAVMMAWTRAMGRSSGRVQWQLTWMRSPL